MNEIEDNTNSSGQPDKEYSPVMAAAFRDAGHEVDVPEIEGRTSYDKALEERGLEEPDTTAETDNEDTHYGYPAVEKMGRGSKSEKSSFFTKEETDAGKLEINGDNEIVEDKVEDVISKINNAKTEDEVTNLLNDASEKRINSDEIGRNARVRLSQIQAETSKEETAPADIVEEEPSIFGDELRKDTLMSTGEKHKAIDERAAKTVDTLRAEVYGQGDTTREAVRDFRDRANAGPKGVIGNLKEGVQPYRDVAKDTKEVLVEKGAQAKEVEKERLDIYREAIKDTAEKANEIKDRVVNSKTGEAVRGLLSEKFKIGVSPSEVELARIGFGEKISVDIANQLKDLDPNSLEYKMRSNELVAEALGALVEAQAKVEVSETEKGAKFLAWFKENPKMKMVIGGLLTAGAIGSAYTGNLAGVALFGSMRVGWRSLVGMVGVKTLLDGVTENLDNKHLNYISEKNPAEFSDEDIAGAVATYAESINRMSLEEGQRIGISLLEQLNEMNEDLRFMGEESALESIIDTRHEIVQQQKTDKMKSVGKWTAAVTSGLVLGLVGGARVADKLASIHDLRQTAGDTVGGAAHRLAGAGGEALGTVDSARTVEAASSGLDIGRQTAAEAAHSSIGAGIGAGESAAEVLSNMPEMLVETAGGGDSIWSMSEDMLSRFPEFNELNSQHKLLATDWMKDHFVREALERGQNPNLIHVGDQISVSTTHAREALQYALTH